MSERKAKENRKNQFDAPAKSSQAHRRNFRTGSRFDYVNEDWTLQDFIDEWNNDTLHLDWSGQRPQDLFSWNTKNDITTTLIHNGAIHQIQIHSYLVDGVWHHDVYNGGNRIAFILFDLVWDYNIPQGEKFNYTSPKGQKPVIKNKSFDEMPTEIRKKIKAFDGISVEIVKNLTDKDLGSMMRQGNTTEPMNEAALSNTAVSDYRDLIRVITMPDSEPMCASPIPGLSQHDIFANLLKNNSKKALGHFQFVSWLGFPRFHEIYLGENIYDGGATNTVTNRVNIFLGSNDSDGSFDVESSKKQNKDKFPSLAAAIIGDLETYALLWKISKKLDLLFHKGTSGLSGSIKMGPMYFLLGLEQSCGSKKKFKLKDAELFLTEFTKAHVELKKDVIEKKTGKEVSSEYANRQGGWSAEDWKIKNGLLFAEMMKDKNNTLEIGLVVLDARRKFSMKQKKEMLKRQGYKCAITGKPFGIEDIADMDADHIVPHSQGGPTEVWNGRMVCRKAHQKAHQALSTQGNAAVPNISIKAA
jgi:hypothetical protein